MRTLLSGPPTATENVSSGWIGPDNALALGGTAATRLLTAGSNGGDLRFTGFDVSAIPDDASIVACWFMFRAKVDSVTDGPTNALTVIVRDDSQTVLQIDVSLALTASYQNIRVGGLVSQQWQSLLDLDLLAVIGLEPTFENQGVLAAHTISVDVLTALEIGYTRPGWPGVETYRGRARTARRHVRWYS